MDDNEVLQWLNSHVKFKNERILNMNKTIVNAKISVIIPVYNEKNTILEVLSKIRSLNLDIQITIVDDFSTDGTREILKQQEAIPNTTVLYHNSNYGKGYAIRSALPHSFGDYIIIQDADLEYNPNDYNKLLLPLVSGLSSVVYGSRFSQKCKNISYLNKFANKFLTMLTNVLFGSSITDMETCYKAFDSGIIKSLNLQSYGFEIEPEITGKILKRKINIIEVPISYDARSIEEGKKIKWRDGIIAIITLLKIRFKK